MVKGLHTVSADSEREITIVGLGIVGYGDLFGVGVVKINSGSCRDRKTIDGNVSASQRACCLHIAHLSCNLAYGDHNGVSVLLLFVGRDPFELLRRYQFYKFSTVRVKQAEFLYKRDLLRREGIVVRVLSDAAYYVVKRTAEGICYGGL